MPQVDIYGNGQRDPKNQSLIDALKDAKERMYNELASATEGNEYADVGGTLSHNLSNKYMKEVADKFGLKAEDVEGVDLPLLASVMQYNGVKDVGQAAKFIQAYSKDQPENSVGDAAGTRDGIANAIANGLSVADARKFADDYQSSHNAGSNVIKNTIKVGMAAIGGAAIAGAGAAAGAASGATAGTTAAGTTASGLAGSLGMEAGMGATALNTGALNAGVSLARGNNIGDALKSGATAALLSGVGGWAKEGIGSALSDSLPSGVANAASTIGANAAVGGLAGAVTGQGVGQGIINGAISGAVSAGSSAVGGWAKSETAEMGKDISSAVGNVASSTAQAALSGQDIGQGIQTGLINTAADGVQDATGSKTLASIAKTALRGGNVNNQTITQNLIKNGASDWKAIGRNASKVTLSDGAEV